VQASLGYAEGFLSGKTSPNVIYYSAYAGLVVLGGIVNGKER